MRQCTFKLQERRHSGWSHPMAHTWLGENTARRRLVAPKASALPTFPRQKWRQHSIIAVLYELCLTQGTSCTYPHSGGALHGGGMAKSLLLLGTIMHQQTQTRAWQCSQLPTAHAVSS